MDFAIRSHGDLAESGFCTVARAEAFLQGSGRGGESRSLVLSTERERLLEDKQLFLGGAKDLTLG